MLPDEAKAWIERKGEDATVMEYARQRGTSVWAAEGELAWLQQHGYVTEERRGLPHQGVYFASVYRVSA